MKRRYFVNIVAVTDEKMSLETRNEEKRLQRSGKGTV